MGMGIGMEMDMDMSMGMGMGMGTGILRSNQSERLSTTEALLDLHQWRRRNAPSQRAKGLTDKEQVGD